ncbi:hypothetical protein D3C81_1762930 [compost metagenome]
MQGCSFLWEGVVGKQAFICQEIERFAPVHHIAQTIETLTLSLKLSEFVTGMLVLWCLG